jgi:hypothetical protein
MAVNFTESNFPSNCSFGGLIFLSPSVMVSIYKAPLDVHERVDKLAIQINADKLRIHGRPLTDTTDSKVLLMISNI